MRVHELAKELGVQSKDLAEYLSSDKKKYAAVSGVDADDERKARSKFGKHESKPVAPAPAKAEEPKKEATGNEVKKEPNPKHNIVTLNFQQNSSNGNRHNNGRNDRNNNRRGTYDNRNNNNNRRGGYTNQQPARPITAKQREEMRDRNQEVVVAGPAREKTAEEIRAEIEARKNRVNSMAQQQVEKPAKQVSDRSDDRNNGERRSDDRNNGERRFDDKNNGGRFGDRNNNGERRSYGDRNNNGERKSYGDRNNNNGERRPYGDRNNNNGGRSGDRNNNNGERKSFGDRNNNNGGRFGDRNNNNSGRFGDRNNNNGGRFGDRNNNNGGRFGDRNNNNGGRFGDKDGNQKRSFGDRNGRGTGTGRRDFGGKSNDAGFVVEQKPDSKNFNRRNDNRKKVRKNEEEKENLKFSQNQAHKKKQQEKKEEVIKTIQLPETISIRNLADKLKVTPAELVKKLFLQGKLVTVNDDLEYEAAETIALEYNVLCEPEEVVDVIADLLEDTEDAEDTLVPRPPVVCVMGHVDHGKTSLLDYIRKSHVTAGESGGITQAIGAYTVKSQSGKQITFLDTPGHEAFTAMRMRGAQSTDIAILVVAADDGVMPQTIEAINHAKAAGVEIIVAINKIDKPNANIEKVKQELTEYGLISEDWGGSTIFCPVSAHTGEGVDNLLEMIMLTAEVLELKANPNRDVRGIVIEAQLDKGRGPVATVLVQKGTLHVGDFVAAGEAHGKVRAMINDKQKRIRTAGPSIPVEIQGLSSVPKAGEILKSFNSEKEARTFAETFVSEGKKKLIDDTKKKLSLDDLFDQIKAGNVKDLNLIVKADVQGSVEAVNTSLLKLSNEEVQVKIIHSGVGNITESDVILASASNAIIIGFNVKPDNQASQTADTEHVDVRLYNVIYNAIEDVQDALNGMLDPIFEEQVIGHADIRAIFKASGVGNIAGAVVTDGKITSKASVRIKRADNLIFDGKISSLKRFKDEVKEVKSGYDCGMTFDGFDKIQEGDTIEAYEMVQVPRKK